MKKLKDPILKNIDKSLPVLNIVRIALIHQPKKLLFRTMTNAKKYYLRPITTYPFQSKLNLQMYHMLTYLKLGILLNELITKPISIYENQISCRVEWSKMPLCHRLWGKMQHSLFLVPSISTTICL